MQRAARAQQHSTADADEIERFSRIAEEWWDENGKFKPLHRIGPVRLGFIRDHAVRHFGRETGGLKPLAGISVLDIGCGGGLVCEPMARMGAQVTGIDASEKNIKVAALHAQRMGLEIEYRCTTPEEIAATTYDLVLALEIVEHVADVELFMQSVCARVKPGGLLIMSTLNRTAKAYAMAIVGAEYVLRWLPRGTHTWDKFLKPAEMAKHLRANGLALADQRGLVFSLLKNSWSLSASDLDVNYLMAAVKMDNR